MTDQRRDALDFTFSEDQIAIAPGYLMKEWTDGDRRYFHYKMDAPILNFVAYLSASYAVHRDRWNDVDIEIYHHPGHAYNVDKMVRAIKEHGGFARIHCHGRLRNILDLIPK